MIKQITMDDYHGRALPLWPAGAPHAHSETEELPTITPFLVSAKEPIPGIVVCPGGGYGSRAQHEGEPIALWLNSLGISAFVLDYRVVPYRHPVPLLDAQRAIRMVRSRSAEWNIDVQRVGVLGFSAGGHLAASAGTQFNTGNALAEDEIEWESCRPDLLILCYPVITMLEYAHEGSVSNLLGEHADYAKRTSVSAERRVSADTPPAFLWHTADDDAVAVENSLLFAAALSRQQVPFELHIYEKGDHGLGIATAHPYASSWTTACADWLRNRGFMNAADTE